MTTTLTDEEIAELHKLYDGGEGMAIEWRAAVLAAHPFLLGEVEHSRAALRERDAAWAKALTDAGHDYHCWFEKAPCPGCAHLRALLEEAGK